MCLLLGRISTQRTQRIAEAAEDDPQWAAMLFVAPIELDERYISPN